MKRIVAIFLMVVVVLGFASPLTTFAYIKPEGEYSWDSDITHWSQWHMPGSTEIILPGTDGLTMRAAACGWFSAYFALYKAGIIKDHKSYNVKNLIEDARKEGAYFGGWLLDMSKLGKIFPDANIGHIKDEDLGSNSRWWGSWGIYMGGYSQDKVIEVAQTLMKRGYYLILCLRSSETSGHYVFLDYVDPERPGDIRIVDSGFPYTWLSEYKSFEGKGMTFGEMWVLDLSNGKNENLNFNRESPYKEGPRNNGQNSPISSAEVQQVLSEMNLEGMKDYQKNLSIFQRPVYPGLNLDNPLELINAQKIVEGKRVNPLLSLASKVVSAIGFLLVGYSLFLVVFYIGLGKTYPRLMKMVFFGRYVIEDNTELVKNGLSVFQFGVRVCAMLGVGVLLASGLLTRFVVEVLMSLF